MFQKFKITSYAFIAALVLVFPSQAVAQCNTQDACAAAAESQGLQLGGNGYAFAGSYGTKGCYSYESGKYQGMAYFGTGGTETAMRATPAKPKYRIETRCEGPQSQAAGADCIAEPAPWAFGYKPKVIGYWKAGSSHIFVFS